MGEDTAKRPVVLVVSDSADKLNAVKEMLGSRYKGVFVRDEEKASRIASAGILCSFGLGVIMSLITWPLIDPIIRLLGSTETIAPYAKQYLTYILIAAPAMPIILSGSARPGWIRISRPVPSKI